MYYHVLIEICDIKTQKAISCIETDKDEDYVMHYILYPYVRNEEFAIDGYTVTKDRINRLKIVTTEKIAKEIATIENNKIKDTTLCYFYSSKDVFIFDEYHKNVTNSLIEDAKIFSGSSSNQNIKVQQRSSTEKKKVFIAHGHDEGAKLLASNFINKVGLSPVILKDEASRGRTIIEKFEEHTNVGYAIALYTPCDTAYVESVENKESRARQNVVFEHGYFIAKLGRENVCALVKGKIAIPTDTSGMVYIDMDANGAWQMELARELKKCGYDIDLNKLL